MHANQKKLSSQVIRQKKSQLIASLMVDGLLLIRPQDYGARHLGAAMERVLVALAVRKCEANGTPCTATKVASLLKMPRTSVQRSLRDLTLYGIVKAVGQVYVAHDDPMRGTLARLRAISQSIIKAGRELERLDAILEKESAQSMQFGGG